MTIQYYIDLFKTISHIVMVSCLKLIVSVK